MGHVTGLDFTLRISGQKSLLSCKKDVKKALTGGKGCGNINKLSATEGRENGLTVRFVGRGEKLRRKKHLKKVLTNWRSRDKIRNSAKRGAGPHGP